jgi:hypothetical protein
MAEFIRTLEAPAAEEAARILCFSAMQECEKRGGD